MGFDTSPDRCRRLLPGTCVGNAGIDATCRRLIQVMVNQQLAARASCVDYLLVGPTDVSEPLPAAETRPGRRTTLTFPLFPPPQ